VLVPQLTQPNRSNSAKKASKRIPTDRDSLQVRSLRLIRAGWWEVDIDFGKVPEERRERQKATQHTLCMLAAVRTGLMPISTDLIVTEKREVYTGNDCNCNIELRARETVEFLHSENRLTAVQHSVISEHLLSVEVVVNKKVSPRCEMIDLGGISVIDRCRRNESYERWKEE
jgi:hypothetical protein